MYAHEEAGPQRAQKQKDQVIVNDNKKSMGVYLGLIMVGVPGVIFLIYCLTPSGRRWMQANNLL